MNPQQGVGNSCMIGQLYDIHRYQERQHFQEKLSLTTASIFY